MKPWEWLIPALMAVLGWIAYIVGQPLPAAVWEPPALVSCITDYNGGFVTRTCRWDGCTIEDSDWACPPAPARVEL